MTQHPIRYDSFIGVDVGKFTLVIHDMRDGTTSRIDNRSSAIRQWLRSLSGRNCLIICEATGRYEAALLELCHHDHVIHRADARKVKAFIRSLGRLAKTDAIDAVALALYGR
ncbi:MAG: transposase, partial [Paracoccus sp. (in: a-proteobacteria)]